MFPYVPMACHDALSRHFGSLGRRTKLLGCRDEKARLLQYVAISSDELSHLTHLTNATWDVGRNFSQHEILEQSKQSTERDLARLTVAPHVFGAALLKLKPVSRCIDAEKKPIAICNST